MTPPRDLRVFGALVNRFLRPYWRSVALTVALNVAVGFALTLRPLVLAPALDSFVGTRTPPAGRLSELTLNNVGPTLTALLGLDPARPLRTGLYAAGVFLIVTVGVAGLGVMSHFVATRTRTAIHRDILVALHRHLLTQPLAYFHKRRAGELVTRLTQDSYRIAGSLETIALASLQSFAQVSMALVVMFRTDPIFSLSVLVTALVHFAITKTLSGRVRRLSATVSDREGDIGARLHETFVGIRAIKSFAAERFDSARLAETAEAYRRRFRRAHFVAQVDTPIRLVADAVAAAVVLALTFYWVAQERLTLQAAALFFYLSQQLLAPISQIFRQWLGVSQLLGEATRVVEIFETKTSMPDGANPAEPLRDRIVLEGVSFAFEPGRPVLSGIDLDIERGHTVALVGPSGAGKTTLADLILRLYDVTAGAIRYDGRDVRELQQRSYRRHFGVVAQESLIFNATARENIVFNRPEDADALAHAVWAANAEEFLRELPQGLDTVLGDRGVRLSGGQRQRIAIARAIYARPSVLILDEATSALDSESEREVQRAIERIGREMTLVVIAHRLSTIVHADKVVVLNRGLIEAEGPHEQVLATSPTYRRLYDLQMSTPVS